MTKSIIITGGFGFIGTSLCAYLNAKGIVPYILELQDEIEEKWRGFSGLKFILLDSVDRLNDIDGPISIVHLGARVDTREKMSRELWTNNVTLTLDLFKAAQEYQLLDRFIYASSGSVYGNEERDFTERIEGLRPTNAYAATKLALDTYFDAVKPKIKTYGLRFFNVAGGREGHKGDMSSLIYKGLMKQSPFYRDGKWRLFKSCRHDILDGEQKRDFVAVEDAGAKLDKAEDIGVLALSEREFLKLLKK